MSKKVSVTEDWFAELIRAEAPNTPAFGRLEELLQQRMSHDASLALRGELDEASSRAMARFRRSIRDRASRADAEQAQLVDEVVDAVAKLEAHRLHVPRPSDEALIEAAAGVLKETKARLGKLLLDDEDARLRALKKGDGTEQDDNSEIVIEQSTRPPALPRPEDLFLGAPPQAVIETWFLSETVTRIHCEEDTPEVSQDDIVVMGVYSYPNQSGRLDITDAEKGFEAGTDHFYNTGTQRTPHSKVILEGRDQVRPTYYLSSHILIESDAWTELAELLGTVAHALVDGPLSKIGGGLGGLSGVPGVGTAGGLGGMILDGLLDAAFDGALSGASQRAHDIVFDLIRKAGVENNIVFESWLTGVMIHWVPTPGSQLLQPRWKARHAVSGHVWDARPRQQNPMTGQGSLKPGRFGYAEDRDIILRPALWNTKQYPNRPSGKYWYMSDITVWRRVEGE